ncbi:MAG: PstS family phosphate ABC transporter substrate-binding protein [candidate division WOR-3 bacterium]
MKRLLTLAIASLLAMGTWANAREIMVKGSDTMLNLVQRLAEAYSAVRPDVTVSVTGGGSGVGINAIVNRECEIANASRGIKSKEVYDAKSNGVNPIEFAIAIDGLSIITNASNPVRKLTTAQIGAIFRGQIKNWRDVGGPNRKITLYGRQPSSGTYVYMRDEVLFGDYDPGMRQMNGNGQIVEAIKGDATGIGYVGVGYARSAQGINVISVAKIEGGEYVSPLDADKVKAGEYPIARALFQYTNGRPRGDVKSFIEFELDPDGQKIVEEEGFFAVGGSYQEQNQANLR